MLFSTASLFVWRQQWPSLRILQVIITNSEYGYMRFNTKKKYRKNIRALKIAIVRKEKTIGLVSVIN